MEIKKPSSTISDQIKNTEEYKIGLFEGIAKGQCEAERFIKKELAFFVETWTNNYLEEEKVKIQEEVGLLISIGKPKTYPQPILNIRLPFPSDYLVNGIPFSLFFKLLIMRIKSIFAKKEKTCKK
jgi:hypothetical protein